MSHSRQSFRYGTPLVEAQLIQIGHRCSVGFRSLLDRHLIVKDLSISGSSQRLNYLGHRPPFVGVLRCLVIRFAGILGSPNLVPLFLWCYCWMCNIGRQSCPGIMTYVTFLIAKYVALSLSGVPDYFYRNKISSGGDLSHYSSASLY